MHLYLLLGWFLLFAQTAHAGARMDRPVKVSYPGGKSYFFRLELKDKSGTPYTLDHPELFLSSRAIERRRRQHLAVDSTDLPLSPSYLRQIVDRHVEIVARRKWNNTVLVRSTSSEKAVGLQQLPFVRKVTLVFTSPDSIVAPRRSKFREAFNHWDTIPSDPYGITKKQIESLNGIRLHHSGFRGYGMLIAVLDGGFMNVDKIPAMQSVKFAGFRNFVYPSSASIFQEIDHGTMVLSTMAVEIPNVYVGTAPKASYLLLRSEDYQSESSAEEDYWASAAEYADSAGVDIINSSLGYHDFDDKQTNYAYRYLDGRHALISRTASMLADKGILLVCSAGNEGMGTWKKINFPADAKDIIAVGSIGSNGLNMAFSSVGPTADGRVKPDVMAPGNPVAVLSGRGSVINDMGTSFSAPLISGLAACLWQALPEMTVRELIDVIKRSSNQYEYPDNIMGYGVPDFWKAYQMGKKER